MTALCAFSLLRSMFWASSLMSSPRTPRTISPVRPFSFFCIPSDRVIVFPSLNFTVPPSTVTLKKFICGEPMNPATNWFTG